MKRRRLTRCAAADQFTEPKHRRISDAIENAVARTLPTNEPGVEQDLKVLRDVWLVAVQIIYDLAHCFRATLQGLKDPKTTRLTQYLKSAGYQIDDFVADHYRSIGQKYTI